MMMMIMMMCKRLAQVPMLCVPIYNMKLAMMQTTPIFTTFSANTKMAADKRGQIEVFARKISINISISITSHLHLHYTTVHYIRLHHIIFCTAFHCITPYSLQYIIYIHIIHIPTPHT